MCVLERFVQCISNCLEGKLIFIYFQRRPRISISRFELPSVQLSVHLSVRSSIHLSVHRCVRPSVRPNVRQTQLIQPIIGPLRHCLSIIYQKHQMYICINHVNNCHQRYASLLCVKGSISFHSHTKNAKKTIFSSWPENGSFFAVSSFFKILELTDTKT